jgi:DNA-binding NarL/FixJ family response regulator
MARVVALIPDLLFGSRVQAMLDAGGHVVELVGEAGALRGALAGATVLVVDLTSEASAGADLLESLSSEGSLSGIRTLAFYSHVDVDVRRRAESAGFDLVVPRSRMAREGAELVSGLAADENGGSSRLLGDSS